LLVCRLKSRCQTPIRLSNTYPDCQKPNPECQTPNPECQTPNPECQTLI
jgi:hypothetical protein